MAIEIPEGLEYWTCDAISECLDGIGDELSRKLWSFLDSGNDKPLGGDGSNGTTEEPIVADDYSNQPKVFWSKLTEDEQRTIADAYHKAYGSQRTD